MQLELAIETLSVGDIAYHKNGYIMKIKRLNNNVATCFILDKKLNKIRMNSLIGKGYHTNIDGSKAYKIGICNINNLKKWKQ